MHTISSFSGTTSFPRFSLLILALAALAAVTVGNIISGGVVLQDAYDVAATGDTDFMIDGPCINCGVVEQIRLVTARRTAAGVSAIFDRLNSNATANRATGSNPDGRKPAQRFRVTVLMHDGSRRVATEMDTPAYSVGDQVKLADTGAVLPRRNRGI